MTDLLNAQPVVKRQLLMVADSTLDNVPFGFQLADISDIEIEDLESHIDELVEALFMGYEDAEWIAYYIVKGEELISYETPTGVIQRTGWENAVGFGGTNEQDELTRQLVGTI